MPRANPCLPRHRFPAPITNATSTPMSWTSLTRLAMTSASPTLIPKPPSPPNASPLNLSIMRLYFNSAIARSFYKNDQPVGWSFHYLTVQTLTQLPTLEAAHDHIFTDGGYRLQDQLLNRERFVADICLP